VATAAKFHAKAAKNAKLAKQYVGAPPAQSAAEGPTIHFLAAFAFFAAFAWIFAAGCEG
jgi:hypothetical protein